MVVVGDYFPNIVLSLGGEEVNLYECLASSGGGCMIGCIGAFVSSSTNLLMSFKYLQNEVINHRRDEDRRDEDRRDGGEDDCSSNSCGGGGVFVGCVCVNDAFVLKGWSKKLRISSEVIFISDHNGTLTSSLNLCVSDAVQRQYGIRSVRRSRDYVAILAADGEIKNLFLDDYTIQPALQLCRLHSIPLTQQQQKKINQILRPAGVGGGGVGGGGISGGLGGAMSSGMRSGGENSWPVVTTNIGRNTTSLIPFLSERSLVIKDYSTPSLRIDYNHQVKKCRLKRQGAAGHCYLYPVAEEEEEEEGGRSASSSSSSFGCIYLDYERVKLFDCLTGARLGHVETPRVTSEVQYQAKYLVIDTVNVLPMSHSMSVGTLVIVHTRRKTQTGTSGIPKYAMLCIPLMSGGRDNLFASLHTWLQATNTTLNQQPVLVQDLSDEVTLNLNKYTHSYMKVYRYQAPAIYAQQSQDQQLDATWLVCEEPSYVDANHLHSVRSAGTAPWCSPGKKREIAFGFLVAAD